MPGPRERMMSEAGLMRHTRDNAKVADIVRAGERPATLIGGMGRDWPKRRREPREGYFV